MPGNKDIGLGAIVSIRDRFTGGSGRIITAVTRLEKRFGIAAGTITRAAKSMAAGFGLVVAGSLIRKAFAGPIKAATDFQQAFSEVATLTDKTVGQLRGLSNELITQSVIMGQLPIDSTKLLYQTISAGATGAADRLLVMNAAQKAATAGSADQNEVLNLLASTVKSYGLEWSAVTKINDLAFQTVKLGQTTMGELAANMTRTLAPAAALNISMEELFGSFATLTGVTGDTAEVATQLRGLFSTLIKPTKQAERAALELGIAWSADAVKAKGLVGVLRDLREATGGDVKEIAKLIPNVRALTGVLALVGGSADEFEEKVGKMQKATGATERAFVKMTATMAFAQKQLAASRQALAILVGTPLLDALRPAVQVVNALFRALINFALANPGIVRMFSTFVFGASVVFTIAGALLLLKGALILLAALAPLALGAVASAFGTIFTFFLPIAGLVTALAVLFSTFTKGSDSLGSGFLGIFRKGKLVWGGLTELINTFDGRFGKMSKSTAAKLRAAGLLELTAKLFALWARARALFEGVAQGFTGAIDAMGESLRIFFPKGSMLRDMFDEIAAAIENLKMDKSIAEWKDFGIMVGTAALFIALAAGALLLAKIAIFGFTLAMAILTSPLLLLGVLIAWLIIRWDELVAAFTVGGLAGAFDVFLSDLVALMVIVMKAIRSIPVIGKSLIPEFAIEQGVVLTSEIRQRAAVLKAREDREERGGKPPPRPRAGGVSGVLQLPTDKQMSQPPLPGLDELRKLTGQALRPDPGFDAELGKIRGELRALKIEIPVTIDGAEVGRAVAEIDRRNDLRGAD